MVWLKFCVISALFHKFSVGRVRYAIKTMLRMAWVEQQSYLIYFSELKSEQIQTELACLFRKKEGLRN